MRLVPGGENTVEEKPRTDLTQLHELLKSEEWKKADLETSRVILKIANRQEQGWLRSKDIETFPCSDFQAIDNLWKKHSENRFGFTVQIRIWHTVTSETRQFNEKNFGKNFRKFGDRVGWYVNEEWLTAYDQFAFTRDAPEGHLPSLRLPAIEGQSDWYLSWHELFKNLVKFFYFCGSRSA